MLYDNGPRMPSYQSPYAASPTPAPPRQPMVLYGGGGGGGGRSYADYYNGLTGQRASSPSFGNLMGNRYLQGDAMRNGYLGLSPMQQRILKSRHAMGGVNQPQPYMPQPQAIPYGSYGASQFGGGPRNSWDWMRQGVGGFQQMIPYMS